MKKKTVKNRYGVQAGDFLQCTPAMRMSDIISFTRSLPCVEKHRLW